MENRPNRANKTCHDGTTKSAFAAALNAANIDALRVGSFPYPSFCVFVPAGDSAIPRLNIVGGFAVLFFALRLPSRSSRSRVPAHVCRRGPSASAQCVPPVSGGASLLDNTCSGLACAEMDRPVRFVTSIDNRSGS